jgi:hypothetical protein
MMNPASTRGTTSLRMGSVPSARSALTWSVTAIEPSSAAMPEPTRPASISAVSTGPSALIIEALTRRPTIRPGAELIQRDARLQRQHRAGEEAGQQHHGERAQPDDVELLDQVVP